MKCFFHEQTDAVATCQSCGKSLCKPCAAKYNPCMCDECYTAQAANIKDAKLKKKQDALIDTTSEFIAAILKGAVCAVLLTLLFNAMNSTPTPVSMSVMFFFVPFGWALITYVEQWLPSFFMSGVVFLIYLAFKLAFSMFFGVFCFLYQIAKFAYKMLKRT